MNGKNEVIRKYMVNKCNLHVNQLDSFNDSLNSNEYFYITFSQNQAIFQWNRARQK